jgi:hypothetical protein
MKIVRSFRASSAYLARRSSGGNKATYNYSPLSACSRITTKTDSVVLGNAFVSFRLGTILQ